MPPLDEFKIWDDYLDALRLTFEDALALGHIDRPIDIVIRQTQGLPRGSVQNVIRAYKELVEEGCVCILRPLISENAVDLRLYVDSAPADMRVPFIGWFGTEDALSDWGFELNNGGHPEEAATIASIMQQDGVHSTVAIIEKSLIGLHYLKFFRDAGDIYKIDVLGVIEVPPIEADKTQAIAAAKATGAQSILLFGFGYGTWGINSGMKSNNWVVPVYGATNYLACHFSKDWMEQLANVTGLDQYDERNAVGQQFLDRFSTKFGRRPGYYIPLYGYDSARIIVDAVRRAEPLSPRGVRDSLERVKAIPAACRAPGTWLKFGRYVHQGWMGAGFLVARKVNAQGTKTVFRGIIEPPTKLAL